MNKQYLKQALEEKKSLRTIALEANKGYSTVRYWVKKHQLTPVGVGGPKGVRPCKHHPEVMLDTGIKCKKCAVVAVHKRRKKIKQLGVEYKGGKCESCGYSRCIAVFEFHHRDPTKKDFTISDKGHCRSWERVKKELDKCILLCANCHRELHAKLKE